ncbi:hypothetical protein [Actinoplanes sp. NPDC051494]|uniref:hypothetical protein n=1 Tax=Actinoplanes sp. NPDC051494 TaxID=3363907 RepID=UPI00379C00B1
MPILNRVKIYGDEVAPHLRPGERLLAIGSYIEPLNGDASRLEPDLSERPTGERHLPWQPPSDKFFEGFDLFAGGILVNSDRINRAFSGLEGAGTAQSIAGRLWRARKKTSMPSSVVTDQRFLLLDQPNIPSDGFVMAFEVDREQIAGVRHRVKIIFQWARIELTFTDGSMIAFNSALLDFVVARQLRRALTDPGHV